MKTLSLFNVVHTPEMEAAALEVLRSGRIASGPYVQAFESGLSKLLNQGNVVTTVDMSSAMHIALYLAGVRSGDDVLTTAFACMATNSPIAALGARAVWVDLAADSTSIDVEDFERAITPKTKAAILYHLAGYPAPAKEIAAICKRHGIVLIEDCDNALLASIDGVPVGSFGDFAVYSFYPNRQINATEGGALVCRSDQHASKARLLRRFGIDPSNFRDRLGEINPDADVPEVGWSFTLNNLCSALGHIQLPTVQQRIEQTRRNAAALADRLSIFSQLHLLPLPAKTTGSYWGFLLQVEERDLVLEKLKSKGVNASKLHQRNDVYSCFLPCSRALPNTTEFQRTVLALPCGWWLSNPDIEYIVDTVKEALAEIAPPPYKISR